MTLCAPLPEDEAERLAALRSYGILDTPPEERFDRLTRIVAEELGVPISVISLVDADRQWFKSVVGLDARETSRDVAFCAHAILDDETMVVENALEDPRFARNPLVTAGPEIRFYAGVPLVTSGGHRLGTLCAIDREPRRLDLREQRLLKSLAAVVLDEMELSAAHHALQALAEDLSERNTAMDAFVHTLSHDLAGPVRRIKSFCDLLARGGSISTEEALEFISRSALHADRLLQDLRAFFLVDRERQRRDFELRACVDDALVLVRGELDDAPARFEIRGVYPRLRSDPALLTTVFKNLIGNSVKYRSPDRPLEVTVHGEEQDDLWQFSVTDNGIGIEERYREDVFKLLFRLHSRAKIPGSGMGLAICEKIVRQCGGTIGIAPTRGDGTRVTFTLPRAGVAQDPWDRRERSFQAPPV